MKKEKNKVSKSASEFGRMGGKAFIKKYGKKKMKELSDKALAKRWGKKSK